MAGITNQVDLSLTLRLSEQAKSKLAERAVENGTDIAGYVSTLVEQNAQQPLSLEQISGDTYQQFLDSGLTDEQLSDLLEKEKHEERAIRRASAGS